MMPRLYSYCIPYDDGAAPNPYWGTCTLVICKPSIRRTAQVGDWIAGTGSKQALVTKGETRDLTGRLVYAMKVTRKLTMKEYEEWAKAELPKKIPVSTHEDRRLRLGDAIYAFTGSTVAQREGVHDPADQCRDLSGEFALLSDHFFYFGDNAVALPPELRPIAQNQQGHRVDLNADYVSSFVTWIEGRGVKPGTMVGKPLLDLFRDGVEPDWCASCRRVDDEQDFEFLDGVHGDELKIDLTQPEIANAHRVAIERYEYALRHFSKKDNKFLNHLAGALGEIAVGRFLSAGVADFDPAFRDPSRGREADLIVFGVGIDVKTSTWNADLRFRIKQREGLDTKTQIVLWAQETHEPRSSEGETSVPSSASVILRAWAHAGDVDRGEEEGDFLIPRTFQPISKLPGALYHLVKG